MISVDTKTQTSSSSLPIGVAAKDESEDTLSFSQLLKGVSVKETDEVVQNGILVLALEDDKDIKATKGDTLLSLLKGNNLDEEIASLGLNPKITEALSPADLKALIKDAQNYLKDKIIASEGFKKVEIAALPKTLKGLLQVAKKFGIDVSKISIEDIKVDVKADTKILSKVEAVTVKPTVKSIAKITNHEDDTALIQKDVGKTNIIEKDVAPKNNKVAVAEVVKIPKDVKGDKVSKTPTTTAISKPEKAAQNDAQLTEQIKTEAKIKDIPKEIKSTPLFKAQAKNEITTEQIVNAKVNTLELRTPKQKADETLKMLIRGDKVTKKDVGMTADFSVATARVIAPQATTDIGKSLETLLRGEQTENSSAVKTDALNIPKADSFEVKLNEAKQMTKYISQDIKTAIEDYKSPFTRVKVQLNPQRLGEVDLTIVQRGKNLHINISSNNVAINTLALNANDLKVQLSNNGINNASLNFSNNSQNSESGFSNGQQQNPHNEKQAEEEYNYFETEETNEEILNSLEIVVPNYA